MTKDQQNCVMTGKLSSLSIPHLVRTVVYLWRINALWHDGLLTRYAGEEVNVVEIEW